MSDRPLDSELSDFAASLRTLSPIASAFSRDELMFRAGQAAANSRRWPMLAAGFGGLAAGLVLGAALLAASWPRLEPGDEHSPSLTIARSEQPAEGGSPRPSPPTAIEPAAQDPVPASPFQALSVPPVGPGRTNYLTTRNHVIRWGADSLPQRLGHAVPSRELEPSEMLDLRRGNLEPRGRQEGTFF